MVIKVGVASKDENYLRRLISKLEKDRQLSLMIYSDETSLYEGSKSRKIDLLLFTEDIFEEKNYFDRIEAGLKILLDSDENVISQIYSGIPTIKKYQRISEIKRRMLDYFSEVCGRDGRSGEKQTSILSFYSPIGGVGKTTVSLVYAKKIADHGSRVLYLNMEDMPSGSSYLENDGDKGLSDLLQYIDSNVNISMKIEGMVKQKGTNLFYLNDFASPNDVYEMEKEDVTKLLSEIRNIGLFDYIIVDMTSFIGDYNMAIFETSDKIFIVERNDEISAKKLSIFYRQRHIINEFKDKMIRVVNFDNMMAGFVNDEIPVIGKIGAISNMSSSKMIDMLANSSKNNFILSSI